MAMMQQVKVIDFNIFDRELSLEWQNVVNSFRDSNEVAKNATRNLIDSSFQRLRSAEGAFELLQNFKKIESKGAIKEQMASKLNDILQQFSREMDTVVEIFEQQRCACLPTNRAWEYTDILGPRHRVLHACCTFPWNI